MSSISNYLTVGFSPDWTDAEENLELEKLTQLAGSTNTVWTEARGGLKGATFHIHYPENSELRAYVMKWGSQNEIDGLAQYQQILNKVDARSISLGCKAPLFRQINPENIHVEALAKLFGKEDKPNTSSVFLMEQVQGQGLAEFIGASEGYLAISDKEAFFRRLGRVVLLDLLMGNTDRLLRLDSYAKESLEDPFAVEANLGNLMVQTSGSDFDFYLIDNELYNHDPESGQKSYGEFFSELVKKDDFFDWTFAQTKQSIQSALCEVPRKVSKPFLDDFSKFKGAFQEGIKTAITTLKETDFSDINFPELQERLACFELSGAGDPIHG